MLDDLVVHVPGRVHPTEIRTWLATLIAVRGQSDDRWPHEIACNDPRLVDFFPPEDVVVWSRAGASKRLIGAPGLAQSELSQSEYWCIYGESWVDL
jgi:hypothetical protein